MKQGSKIAGGNPERGRVDNDYYTPHPDSTKAFLEVWEAVSKKDFIKQIEEQKDINLWYWIFKQEHPHI